MAAKYSLTETGQTWLDESPVTRTTVSLMLVLMAFEGADCLSEDELGAKMQLCHRVGTEFGASAQLTADLFRAIGLAGPAVRDAVRRGYLRER